MLISHISEEIRDEAHLDVNMSEPDDINSSVQRDLVILYENADSKQKSISFKNNHRMPNQHVENVVYKEDHESEDSDLSDIYCSEDVYDVVLINKERIDLFNNVPSIEKTLCQKFGDMTIQSGFPTDYDRQHLSKNSFVKGQYRSLNNISNFSTFDGTPYSTCLLDFICCNQLDDNSNFYMESIIQYAKRTIDQLKRISNGDYLTDKAKEQWKMPGNGYKSREGDDISKAVMAKSDTFRVESDGVAFESTLRDLVRSELDMRFLSKILEKGRSVRIPRLIVGSCKLFGECRGSDLIIKCKQGKRRMALEDSKSSQFEIILKLAPDDTEKQDVVGPVIIFQQALPCIQNEPFLPLEYKHSRATSNNIDMQNKLTITEINESDFEESARNVKSDFKYPIGLPFKSESSDTANTQSSVLCISDISLQLSDPMSNCSSDRHIYNNDESSTTTKASCTMTPDDLFCTIQQFNAQTAPLEDIEECPLIKKKSPTKVRIKSPYENKTFAIEERKRRKLLEIRERREKRKKALSENCKVTKHKYGKSAIMAQSSNSVTKLSITNKSFYASIYGDNANIINKHDKRHSSISEIGEDDPVRGGNSSDENRKFVDRSYYFDDPETEVMNIQIKNFRFNNAVKDLSASSSNAIMNDISIKSNSFVQLGKSSPARLNPCASGDNEKYELNSAPKCIPNSKPTATITTKSLNNQKKAIVALECKQSIDKIYELMKKLSSVDSESSYSKRQFSPSHDNQYQTIVLSSTIQATDSGTSIKHRPKSSNPSIYSFEDHNKVESSLAQSTTINRAMPEANVVSKVIISNKSQINSNASEIKSPKKVTIKEPANISKNPLKAISHLINEFDNIQKNRQKGTTEVKDYRKVNNTLIESRNMARQSFLKKVSRVDNSMKDTKSDHKKNFPSLDKKLQPRIPVYRGKASNYPVLNAEKTVDREKKFSDLIDDALRESRGEAVKGPSKPYTRLESLAQPKRFAIGGQEEIKSRHGKHSLQDKTAHFAPRTSLLEKPSSPVTSSKARQKRNDQECGSPTKSTYTNYIPPTEKIPKIRRSQHTSNNFTADYPAAQVHVPTYKQRNLLESSRAKKMTPIDNYTKKRPLSLTQTAGSSNLLQKTQISHAIPAQNVFLQTKDSTLSIPDPVKDINSLTKVTLQPIPVNTNSFRRLENNRETKTESINKIELISISSDYAFDVLEDKNVLTAVESICTKNGKCDEEQVEINSKLAVISKTDIKQCDEITEGIENLEKALYQQLSQGIFQKRPKVKNLTLTPKQSLHKVFLLQCGDTNSLLVKSCMSKNLQVSKTKSITTSGIGLLPSLSKSYMDWSFPRDFTNITTIGYAIPKSRSIECGCNTISKLIDVKRSNVFISNKELTIDSNYEKGVQTILDKYKSIEDFRSECVKEANQRKVNKSTEWGKTLLSNTNENSEKENAIENENIDNTTSLDILTELMEEIEKITKYQSLKAMNGKHKMNQSCYILTNNSVCDNSTSCLDENGISNSDGFKIKTNDVECPKYVDKEVAVYITKECVNEFTDVPSQLWFSNENFEHTSNSLAGVISQRSSRSLVSLYDYRAYYLNKFKDIPSVNGTFSQPKQNNFSLIQYKKKTNKTVSLLENKRNCGQINIFKTNRKEYSDNAYCVDENDLNATLKMKRDILVTVYSILVFTVFAALTFPDFLYHY